MVATAVEALHGTVVLESRAGEGTKVTITVPTSRALQDAVLVTAAGQTWGIPAIAVLDRLPLASAGVRDAGGRLEMTWDGATIPVLSFAETVGLRATEEPQRLVIVSTAVGPTAFMVARELGRRQVAARELGPILEGVPHLTGAAMLGGGDVVVLVDPNRLASRARNPRQWTTASRLSSMTPGALVRWSEVHSGRQVSRLTLPRVPPRHCRYSPIRPSMQS